MKNVMNKTINITPLKNLFITRDGNVYWYVGDKLNTINDSNEKIDLIACRTDLNNSLSVGWTNGLFAKRDGYWDIFAEEARDKDIIFIYEIIDMTKWLNIFHKYNFITPDMIRNGFTRTPYTELIYERVESAPKFNIKK